MITGNHDEIVVALSKGEPHPVSHAHVKEHHEWIEERIDVGFVSKLGNLPRFIRKDILGHSILFTHYHVDTDKMASHISNDPFARIVLPSLENMEALFGSEDAKLICFGHHHPTHYFTGEHTAYLNPGSLGCAETPIARYGVVTVEAEGIHVDLLEAMYDNSQFIRSFDKLKVPSWEFILKAFYGNQLKTNSY